VCVAEEDSLVGVVEALPGRLVLAGAFPGAGAAFRIVMFSNSVFAMSAIEEAMCGSTRGLDNQALR